MKYFTLLILSFFSGLVTLAQTGTDNKREYTRSFGIITEGKADTAIFNIYNSDTSAMALGKWRGGCGCVRLRIIDKLILPHQFGKVQFIYNSSGNRGSITRFARIALVNGNKGDSLTLSVTGYVLPKKNVKMVLDSATDNAIRFYTMEHDFGTIDAESVAEYKFRFINTSVTPVVINYCQSSCGCIVPEWPVDPILPGQSNVIGIKYNASGQRGPFNKTVSVEFSNRQRMVLTVKGRVQMPLEFESESLQLDTLPSDSAVSYKFTYMVNSKAPVSVTHIERVGENRVAVAGVFEYSKTPLKQGQKGTIKGIFNTAGHKGHSTETVTVYFSNGDYRHLRLEAFVK